MNTAQTNLNLAKQRAFNSLSRDHLVSEDVIELPLEVASFNSLSRDHIPFIDQSVQKLNDLGLSTPSLGITLMAAASKGLPHSFQLPLSGSHLRFHAGDMVVATLLSTPSLGITRMRTCAPMIYHLFLLSTPSLGITEPDSGIFRLSAAFCRGAPSHR